MLCDIPYSKISHLIPINSVLTGHASSPPLRIKIKLNAVNHIWGQNNLIYIDLQIPILLMPVQLIFSKIQQSEMIVFL